MLGIWSEEIDSLYDGETNQIRITASGWQQAANAYPCIELCDLIHAETAEVLEITESNVKVRLNRAKGMLQKELKKIYSETELYEFNLIYCDAMVDRVMKKITEQYI